MVNFDFKFSLLSYYRQKLKAVTIWGSQITPNDEWIKMNQKTVKKLFNMQ